jgi:hypothetical protein
MSRAFRAREILTFLCPLCGAKPGRKCHLGGGEPRNTSHQDRRWAATDSQSRDSEPEDEMWIRPHAARESSRDNGDRAWKAWNIPAGFTVSSSRYLQLAKMAYAVKKSDWK